MSIEITAEPDDDEPEKGWLSMEEPSYEVSLYLALEAEKE